MRVCRAAISVALFAVAMGSENPLLEAPEVLGCTPAQSFVRMTPDNANLVRSNLGGQGGRCSSTSLCEETCAPCAGELCTEAECAGKMAQEIYFTNVGVNREPLTTKDACMHKRKRARASMTPSPRLSQSILYPTPAALPVSIQCHAAPCSVHSVSCTQLRQGWPLSMPKV